MPDETKPLPAKQPVDEKVVFGVAPNATGDGAPLVLLGIPALAWENLKGGKCSTFDLTRIGIPVKLMVYGAENHDAAMKVITDYNKAHSLATLDLRREDFGLKPKG